MHGIGMSNVRQEAEKYMRKLELKAAQQMLDKRLDELSQQYTATLENRNVQSLSFMHSWLNDVMSYKVRDTTMTQYNYVFDSYIAEYKPFHGIKLQELTPAFLQSCYNTQLKAELSPNRESDVFGQHQNGHQQPYFQRKLKEVGLPVIRFHDLRHSAVHALRKGGCDTKDIQAWLGTWTDWEK